MRLLKLVEDLGYGVFFISPIAFHIEIKKIKRF